MSSETSSLSPTTALSWPWEPCLMMHLSATSECSHGRARIVSNGGRTFSVHPHATNLGTPFPCHPTDLLASIKHQVMVLDMSELSLPLELFSLAATRLRSHWFSSNDDFGESVSLSGDGSIVAVGADNSTVNSEN